MTALKILLDEALGAAREYGTVDAEAEPRRACDLCERAAGTKMAFLIALDNLAGAAADFVNADEVGECCDGGSNDGHADDCPRLRAEHDLRLALTRVG